MSIAGSWVENSNFATCAKMDDGKNIQLDELGGNHLCIQLGFVPSPATSICIIGQQFNRI